jgi:hypothetical protein
MRYRNRGIHPSSTAVAGPSHQARRPRNHQRRCTLAVTLEQTNRPTRALLSRKQSLDPSEPWSSSPEGKSAPCPTVRAPVVRAQARGRHVSDRFVVALLWRWCSLLRARPAGTSFRCAGESARRLHAGGSAVCWNLAAAVTGESPSSCSTVLAKTRARTEQRRLSLSRGS